MNKPKRSDDKYWTGTRDFDDIQFISDLEDYIFSLEERIEALTIQRVSQQRELLKGDYSQRFIDWKTKYFLYRPKTYEYKSKNSKERYTLTDLHKRYERAMLESPFNCG